MKSMRLKKRYFGIFGLMVFFVSFIWLGILVNPVMASEAKSEIAKQSPAKCPDAKEISIDIGTSALLMLHWQNDLIKPEGKLSKPWGKRIQEDKTIDHAKAILEAAREMGMYIIFVNIGFQGGYPEVPPKENLKGFIKTIVEGEMLLQGTWGASNIDELKPLKNEPIVWNYTASSFEATALDRILRNRGITTLYLSGVATNYVVENTMRAGRDIGYRNVVLMDCCNTYSEDVHCWPLANTMGHMAIVSDSKQFMEGLKKIK